MGTILENFTFRTAKRNIYDWKSLLDGQIHRLVEGEDFYCKPESFRGAARAAAKTRGFTLQTAMEDNAVVLQATRSE